jgi:hypothetical protein
MRGGPVTATAGLDAHLACQATTWYDPDVPGGTRCPPCRGGNHCTGWCSFCECPCGESFPWPVEFSSLVRELVIARDTPPGMGRPFCVVCGGPVTAAVVHIHHVLFRGRGGDGRPSNGIVVHGDGQGEGCHMSRIHHASRTAGANGWARSRHADKPGVYRAPVRCARRGWIVLDDQGGWRPDAG